MNSRRLRSPWVVPAAAVLLLGLPGGASAELVVLEDGRFLRAVSYALEGERVKVDLRGGGTVTVDLSRVERIVDDEVDRSEPAPPVAVVPAGRSVRVSSRGAAPGRPGSSGTSGPAGTAGTAGTSGTVGTSGTAVPAAYAGVVAAAAREHRLDPAFVAAVIRAESNFSPRAVSRKGARGLMQLMPATARRLGVVRPFDPGENVRGGTAYLSALADRYGETNVELILAAYNAGEGAVDAYGGVPPYRETREYVRRVAAFWGEGPAGPPG